MHFINPNSALPLPVELYALLPLALIVAVVAMLFAGRGETDTRGVRSLARYLGAVGLLTLFVALYAAFGAVGSLTDLVVDHRERARVTFQAEEAAFDDSGLGFFDSGGFGTAYPILFPIYDFSYDTENGGNYDYAVASGFVAMAAGGAFALHARWRRRLRDAAPGDTIVAAADTAYACGVCGVAALTLAVALSSMAYAAWEMAVPGVAGYGLEQSVIRAEGLAEFLAFGVLAGASAWLFRGSARSVWTAVEATAARRRSPASTKKTTRARTR